MSFLERAQKVKKVGSPGDSSVVSFVRRRHLETCLGMAFPNNTASIAAPLLTLVLYGLRYLQQKVESVCSVCALVGVIWM